METIRIILAERDLVQQQQVATHLQRLPAANIHIFSASTESQLIEIATTELVHLIVVGQLDISDIHRCFQALGRSNAPILRLMRTHNPEHIALDLLAGTSGYITYSAAEDEWIQVVTSLLREQSRLDASVASVLLQLAQKQNMRLTPYGQIVLAGVAQGHSEQEIVLSLQQGSPAQFTVESVRNHVYNVIRMMQRQ